MNIEPIKVQHGQDIGEVMGWDGDEVWVRFLGETVTVPVPVDELIVIQGNMRFDAMRGMMKRENRQ